MLAALFGVVNAFDIPGRQSFLVDMVGKEDLMNAIALNSSMFNGARIIGPAIAGILVAKIGEGWCFAVNAISYIAVIIGLLYDAVAASGCAGVAAAPPPGAHRRRVPLFVRVTPLPFSALLITLGRGQPGSRCPTPYSCPACSPIRVLHGGSRGLGNLMGATGVGAVLGAALTLAAPPR